MKHRELLNSLSNCINHCNHCADSCLDEENVKMMVDCIRKDRICASVCASLADVLTVKNADAQDLVNYCAKVCTQCADECEKHNHQHCQDCAKACRECAEACRSYAA